MLTGFGSAAGTYLFLKHGVKHIENNVDRIGKLPSVIIKNKKDNDEDKV